jgi:hypothetical protein
MRGSCLSGSEWAGPRLFGTQRAHLKLKCYRSAQHLSLSGAKHCQFGPAASGGRRLEEPAMDQGAFVSLTVGPHRQELQAARGKHAPHVDHCSANAHVASQSCASYSRTTPFFCTAFSADMRVITDVATSPVRGSHSKCADVRCSNADRAASILGHGESARIGVRCEVQRSFMVRVSHSGSCEHDSGDKCSRQKFGFSHFVLHQADPYSGCLITRRAFEPRCYGTRQSIFEC